MIEQIISFLCVNSHNHNFLFVRMAVHHKKSVEMRTVIKSIGIFSCIILSGCASDPIDPLNPAQAAKSDLQPQCPVGYEPVYSTEIVIKSTDDDKKTGKAKQVFNCELIR